MDGKEKIYGSILVRGWQVRSFFACKTEVLFRSGGVDDWGHFAASHVPFPLGKGPVFATSGSLGQARMSAIESPQVTLGWCGLPSGSGPVRGPEFLVSLDNPPGVSGCDA